MEKLFYKIRFAECGDIPELKRMWNVCFGDSECDIQSFFNTAFSPEKCVVADAFGSVVSALYLLESDIYINNKPEFSYYVYAVSTLPEHRHNGLMKKTLSFAASAAKEKNAEFLFLVPETRELFSMYEKLGYENGISYSENEYQRNDFSAYFTENYIDSVNYNVYRKFRLEAAESGNTVIFREIAYNYINSSKLADRCAVAVSDGYCFYEKNDGRVIVNELCGNLLSVVGALFSKEKTANKITVRLRSTTDNSHKFGMYLPLGCENLYEGYFGLPYG